MVMIINKLRSFINQKGFPVPLFHLIVACSLLYGCATTKESAMDEMQPLPQSSQNVISLVDIDDYRVKIGASDTFDYTIYKPSDPFKVVVEMKGVEPGDFRDRIVTDKEGISEIMFSTAMIPEEKTIMEVTLTTPLEITSSFFDNVLTLEMVETAEGFKEETYGETTMAEVEKEKEEYGIEFLPEAENILGVSFQREPDAVKVIIQGDGSMMPDVYPLDNRVVIDIPDVKITASLPKEVAAPLQSIRWTEHEEKVRIVLNFKENTAYDIVSLGDSVVVSLTTPEMIETALEKVATPKISPAEKMPSEILAGKGKEEEPIPLEEERYTGKKISLDFQDADVVPIFRLLTDVSGYNFVVDPKVKGKITMKLVNVPWDQALDLILKTHKLDKVVEGNIIRIAPVKALAEEKKARAAAEAASVQAEPLVAKVFPISYAKVGDVKKFLEGAKIVSARGNVSVDERTSSLIVKDVPSSMPEVEKLIVTLDKATPQVLIEARIVEVRKNESLQFGIDWGLFKGAQRRRFGIGSNFGGLRGDSFLSPPPGGIPNALATGALGTSLALGFLNATQTLGLDLRISALEALGKTDIISNPRILTMDNQKASISQGETIPFPVLTSEGTVSVNFKDVVLSIDVTPHITPDNSIIMDVNIVKEDVGDPVQISGSAVPGTTKLESETKVLIRDGETFVIGGIYRKSDETSASGIPGLKDVPVLGWFFKREVPKTEDVTEIIIFITPRTVEKMKGV